MEKKYNLRALYRELDDIESAAVSGNVSLMLAEEVFRLGNYQEPKTTLGSQIEKAIDEISDPVDHVVAKIVVISIPRFNNIENEEAISMLKDFLAKRDIYIQGVKAILAA